MQERPARTAASRLLLAQAYFKDGLLREHPRQLARRLRELHGTRGSLKKISGGEIRGDDPELCATIPWDTNFARVRY